jgi:hypothetical protein
MKEKRVYDILMEKVGEKEIKKIWETKGMYGTARILAARLNLWVQGYHIAYLADKFSWIRYVKNRECPIYKSVLSGQVPASHFKHIIFL